RETIAALERERDRGLDELGASRAAQLERDQRHAEEIAIAKQRQLAAEHAAQAAAEQLAATGHDDVGAATSMAEVVAQLEAELEHKRAELTAERAASNESRQRVA